MTYKASHFEKEIKPLGVATRQPRSLSEFSHPMRVFEERPYSYSRCLEGLTKHSRAMFEPNLALVKCKISKMEHYKRTEN